MTMTDADRIELVRAAYRAYEQRDRDLIEGAMGEGLTFFAPTDPGIDRAEYFERCWPNAATTEAFEFKRLSEVGDEVLVTYEATRTDGTRFRNTEIFAFDGGKISRVEVYFGWNLE
jgi:ketosteroid isomerase-like protein